MIRLGKYNVWLTDECGELYHKCGFGVVLRGGCTGTECGDPRRKMFKEVRLFVARHIFELRIAWKSNKTE